MVWKRDEEARHTGSHGDARWVGGTARSRLAAEELGEGRDQLGGRIGSGQRMNG